MQTDRKKHFEAGGTSGIPRCILICEVKKQGLDTGSKQSGFAALILEKSNVEQLCSFGKYPKKLCSIRLVKDT